MVYVVVVYDVEADRTRLFLKYLRRYLIHVQQSVFEGEVTAGNYEEITGTLESMLQPGESVIVYEMGSAKYVTRSVYGDDPTEDNKFI